MIFPTPFSRLPSTVLCLTILAIALSFGVLAGPVSAAPDQDNFDCTLGDTIDLHGVSYVSDQVYLFMTGPGLPANGVTLTDPTLRADQGHFTTVGVNSDQTWSMKWDTHRILEPDRSGNIQCVCEFHAGGLLRPFRWLQGY